MDALRLALASGADVKFRSSWEQTALHAAVKSGHAECASLHLAAGAPINAEDEDGDTPLIAACHGHNRTTHPECVRLLLAKGANVKRAR